MTRPAALALAFGLASCAAPAPPAAPAPAQAKHAGAASCRYDARLVSLSPAVLDVSALCIGADLDGFVASERAAAPSIDHVVADDGTPLVAQGDGWRFPHRTNHGRIHYRIDLDQVAQSAGDLDVAMRVGRSMLTTVSTWILRPDPLPDGAPVVVHVETPAGGRFVTGLHKVGDDYTLETQEIRVATYAVFGDFALDKLELPGPGSLGGSGAERSRSELDVATLDAHLDAPAAERLRWIRESATAVSRFWNGFPVPRALLVVVPVADRHQVLFGKVLPESRPGVILLVGEHARRPEMLDDWILVHELFHIGSPSYVGEGKWLDEGLATYYEPLIRARAGWLTEQQVWSGFAHSMPQGLPAVARKGLESATSYRGVYWGGAIMTLMADVAIRRASGGKRGLEDGFRAVLAEGGNCSEVWSLADTMRAADRAVGGSALEDLAKLHAFHGRPIAFDNLLHDLGVERTPDGVRLHDDAPLASIRRAVVYGGP